jgi:hypothetical protein
VTSALRLVLGVEAEVDERVVALAGFHEDITTTSAVSAARSTAWNKLLSPEGHAAVAATTGGNANFCFIYEH